MDTQKVIAALEAKYPGKRIIQSGKDSVTEIVCEIEPAKTPDDSGKAVAVIDKSEPHYHKKTTEHYRIIKGELVIYADETAYRLRAGEKYKIDSGKIHYAVGNETWVEVISNPGWSPSDHFLVL